MQFNYDYNAVPYIPVLLTVWLPYLWLRSVGSLNDPLSVTVAVAKYVPPATGVALVFHWALQVQYAHSCLLGLSFQWF